jgi:hypothetical protein
MANRTGTYIAFDALGKTNPTESDFRYYSTIKMWAAAKNIDFKITNSHEKAGAVRDTSLITTLQSSIRVRLAASKQCLIILSDNTRKSGSMLSYEIEKAVDTYKIPLIIAYVGYNKITKPKELSSRWPTSLHTRINADSAGAIHIPYTKKAITAALSQFDLNNMPNGSLNYYTSQSQDAWNK